jgi:hypothetical protein
MARRIRRRVRIIMASSQSLEEKQVILKTLGGDLVTKTIVAETLLGISRRLVAKRKGAAR